MNFFAQTKRRNQLALTLCGFFLATTQALASDPTPFTAQETENALSDIVKESVSTLDHDVLVFHYRPRRGHEDAKTVEASAAKVYTNYVAKMIYGATSRAYGSSVFGPGLYAASDPEASRDYGRSDWLLFQIRVRKGSRLLNLMNFENVLPFPKRLSDGLRQHFGCNSSSTGSIVSDETCFSVRKIILQKLSITATRYYWGYAGIPSDLCDGEYTSSALFFTNLVPFRAEDIRVFSKDSGNYTENRKMIQGTLYFSGTGEDGLWPWQNPWWPFKEFAHEKTREWVSQNILGCETSPKKDATK